MSSNIEKIIVNPQEIDNENNGAFAARKYQMHECPHTTAIREGDYMVCPWCGEREDDTGHY